MYRLDWIEQLKLRVTSAPRSRTLLLVSPVVWSLGFTSLLTDVSTEMVNSVLPVYLVLHLHLNALQYGVIDGLYNGFGIALLSLAAGLVADRWRRHKEVAAFGYGLSAVSKVLLLASGGAWLGIAGIIGLDRAGKGLRAAPRDALISFNTRQDMLASAFAVHRSLDAGGALVGPVVAFLLLMWVPGAFDVMWLVSFVFAVLGLMVLALFVPAARELTATDGAAVRPRAMAVLLGDRRFRTLCLCALVLSLTTLSDGFVYLLLQERSATPPNYIPLFYVGTACFYMVFSIPVGVGADRWGTRKVLVSGYGVLALVYAILLAEPVTGVSAAIGCLVLMGLYYASTEGVLMAMSSAILPVGLRTSGLALIGTALGVGKMFSSVVFGWLMIRWGASGALTVFVVALACALAGAAAWLRKSPMQPQHA